GLAPELAVQQQRNQYKATSAQLPTLQAQARAQVHALSLLLGLDPEALSQELAASSPLPGPPPTVPAGMPADLLRRRPDLRAAQRQLAAANAQLGVAVAQLYPTLTLNGTGGFVSTTAQRLFDWNSAQGYGYGTFNAPLYQGGRLRANVRIA